MKVVLAGVKVSEEVYVNSSIKFSENAKKQYQEDQLSLSYYSPFKPNKKMDIDEFLTVFRKARDSAKAMIL